ncbi:MAG: hypothetical protein HZC36_06675 [Armatimonadetes bacterium]|nr:hypothetical protein [Armatimonadota bacterium]
MLKAKAIVPILVVLCALFPLRGLGGRVQDYHPTTPGLTAAETSIDLTVPQAMERATSALRAAGLVTHKPMEHTIGGNNEWVMALIDCTPSGGKTRVVVSAASNPTRRGESYRVCMFLIEYMRTGKTPANGGLSGSVIGVWEWKWENYIGSGTSMVTLQQDGKATCPDPGWAPGEWWVETDGTVRVYWPTSYPKTNTHYSMVFTLAQDGRTMSTSAGNYYYKSVKATRIGGAPSVTPQPGVSLEKLAPGVWEWKWQGYTGAGTSQVTLTRDGKVTCPDPGWQPGEWWVQDGKVMVYWPSSSPRTNLHYVVQFAITVDGRSMTTTSSNYYYQSVTAARVGDVPSGGPPAGGGSTGGSSGGATGGNSGGGAGGGFRLPEPGPGETATAFGPPKYAPGPLPLPPVGAQGGGVKTALLYRRSWPLASVPSRQSDVNLVALKAIHVEDQYVPDGYLLVEVELSKPSADYTVDLYVGGYLIAPKDGVDGVKNAGFRPAYEWVGLGWFNSRHPDQMGKIRQYRFSIPRVLPAKIRAELYWTPLGKPRTFVSQQETSFTMPWGDQACVMGTIIGDKDKDVVTQVAALVTAGTTDLVISIPGEVRPESNPYINDFVAGLHFKDGETEYRDKTIRYLNRKVKWRELSISVGPPFKDRDHRNNRFWPGLTNGGYVEGEPIWIGGSGRAG